MGLFRKKQSDTDDFKSIHLIKQYIKEAKVLGFNDKEIKRKLRQKKFSNKNIKKSFKTLNDPDALIESSISMKQVIKTLSLGKNYFLENNDLDKTFDLMVKRIEKYAI